MHFFAITRATAKAVGFPYYFQGSYCKNGESWQRRTDSGACLCRSCRVKLYERRVGQRKEDPIGHAEKRRLFWERNSDRLIEKKKADYVINRDKICSRRRDLNANNREKYTAANRKWREENRNKVCEYARTREIRKSQRTPIWYGELDRFVMQEAFALSKARLSATGVKWEVDHMLPLKGRRVSGLHCASNVQVIPKFLNNLKWNAELFTEPDDWLCALI